jgi:hypothetical protein
MWWKNFDVLIRDDMFYVNVNLDNIIKHAINFYVFVTIVVSEYKYKNSSISSIRIKIVNNIR